MGMVLQFFLTAAGVGLNAMRRSIITNAFNLALCIVALSGLFGAIKLHTWYLMCHWVLSAGITTILLGYVLLEMLALEIGTTSTWVWVAMHVLLVWEYFFAFISIRLFLELRKQTKIHSGQRLGDTQAGIAVAAVALSEGGREVGPAGAAALAREQQRRAESEPAPGSGPQSRRQSGSGPPAYSAVPLNGDVAEEGDLFCIFCGTDVPKAVSTLLPCRHKLCCRGCTAKPIPKHTKCPLCDSMVLMIYAGIAKPA